MRTSTRLALGTAGMLVVIVLLVQTIPVRDDASSTVYAAKGGKKGKSQNTPTPTPTTDSTVTPTSDSTTYYEPTATPTPEPTSDSETAPSCGNNSNAIVVKLRPGESIGTVNSKYSTTVLRHFSGTDIYVLSIPAGRSAEFLATKVNREKKVEWAEAGMFGTSADVSSPVILDGFHAAGIDGFASVALDGFTSASLDGFTSVALEGFASVALDGFHSAALDGFTQAAIDGFSQAAIEGFTQATIDYFGQTALDGFSNAALEGFMQAAIDGFTQSSVDGFSMTIADGFTPAAIEGFSFSITDAFRQASLAGFSQAATDGFALAVTDAFRVAALDSFTEAALAGFTLATIEGFSLTSLDGFGLAALEAFEAAVLAEFGQAGLDQLTQTDIDGFTLSIADGFTEVALDGFTAVAIEGFGLAALDGFSAAGLDSVMQLILMQFDVQYFTQLLLETLDSNYGARARQQLALASIDSPLALQHSTGAGTLVAVIDTGITDHWFLRGKIASGSWDYVDGDADPTDTINGLDDNGNGLVDEGSGHGTHVAGIVSLVAPDAQILPIRVQDSDGGGWSFILAEAILYATDRGAHVINTSLEVLCQSMVLDWAVNYADERGVVVVASAGNDDSDAIGYPAALPNTVAVAAVDNHGNRASFSNHGPEITIAAPGVGIYSTYRDGRFAWWSGTSQAAPIVAGEAALIKSKFPWLLASEIVDVIVSESSDIGLQNPGHDWRRGNPYAAVTSALRPHEFLVNSYTPGSQATFDRSRGVVAMDALGNYVVTWASYNQNTSNSPDVYAQRFDAAGVSQGPEFLVNTSSGGVDSPVVAMNPHGNFVVVWIGSYGVNARLFDASGVPLQPELRVSGDSWTGMASVAMDAVGNFVVTWSVYGQDSATSYGVYAQRFDNVGVPKGSRFLVNTVTRKDQRWPDVAMSASGDFVITWSSYDQDGSSWGAYAQRYDAAEVPQGPEFRVNSSTATSEKSSTIGMDAIGNFVITWERGYGGIYAQRFDAAGTPQGKEFHVDMAFADGEYTSAALDDAGNFVITWSAWGRDSNNDFGVFAQKYDAAGLPQGKGFRVNTLTSGNQQYASVAMNPSGSFVIVWSGHGPGDDDGVFGRRFE